MKITCDFVETFHDGKVNADNDYHPIDSRHGSRNLEKDYKNNLSPLN